MISQDRIRAALDILGPGARLDVSGEHLGLTRYACSQVVLQHDEEQLRVRARVNRDGAAVSGTLGSLEEDEVRAFARRVAEAPRPARPAEPAGPAPAADAYPEPVAPPVSEATANAGAAERHDWFRRMRDGLGGKAELGGAIRHDVVERVVADHDGLYRREVLTKTALQALAERDGHSASVRRVHRDAASIELDDVPERLLSELPSLPGRDDVSGPVRVLLRPQAAIALLGTYGYASLGAAGYAENRTAVAGRMGEPVVGELLTVTDDGNDPAGLPSGFDVEGTPRRRTPLIERGVLRGVVSDLRHASVTGGLSTGHGVPLAWRFGADPSPSHLLLDPGETPESDLLGVLGEGLVINRLDYLRVLHPKDTLVTGTTRDVTYWVSGGRPVAWHRPVRLTFRMDEVLRAVVAVGDARERGEQVFMESVVAPSLVVAAGPIAV